MADLHPAELIAMLQAGSKNAFNAAVAEAAAKDPMLAQAMAARGRPFGQPTAYDTFKAATGYSLREDGANFHCKPTGRAETECRIFDFLQDQLGKTN